MRYVHLTIVVLFAAAIVVFCFQNFQTIEVSFLRFNVHVPLALLMAGIYVLGALTGGSLLALLRQSWKGANLSGDSGARSQG
jgi:uncharacterized integral membrane protein